MPHDQQYMDPVRFAWESLNRAPWPDEAITRWTGSMATPAPEVVEARKQRKNAATRLTRRTSEVDRERRRAYAAAAYARKKAARQAATLATYPSAQTSPAVQAAA